MKNIKIALWGTLVGLSVLWIAANLPFPETLSILSVRNLLVQYSGVLAIGAMSVAMILATRSTWLEGWLNGLDKTYRLHKWLGITALAVSVLHWTAVNGPKWMIGLGLMERPDRGGPPAGQADLGAVQTFLNAQRGTAEMIGEWAFYAAVVLIVLALIRRFPYRLFASTHTLIAAVYLALVFHGAVLMNFDAWTQPVGVVTALLMIGGVVSALLALTRRIGRNRRVAGAVESVRSFADMGVTEIHIKLDDGWKGHKAGQFAFVTFDKKEGKHPFTIASAWDPKTGLITFITKALGDYTGILPGTIRPGGQAMVEGPYGRFTFDDRQDRQIWIGAGIGITPFIARMKQLAHKPDAKPVDLIHSVKEIVPEALALLTEDAKAANVNLHVLVEGKDGLLDGARLRKLVPGWKSASVWFCGPAAFGQTLRHELIGQGLGSDAFHQELFNMR